MLTPQAADHAKNGISSSENIRIWSSLKLAIANSSGFQRWQGELHEAEIDSTPLDQLVTRYLRETLATLAY